MTADRMAEKRESAGGCHEGCAMRSEDQAWDVMLFALRA